MSLGRKMTRTERATVVCIQVSVAERCKRFESLNNKTANVEIIVETELDRTVQKQSKWKSNEDNDARLQTCNDELNEVNDISLRYILHYILRCSSGRDDL